MFKHLKSLSCFLFLLLPLLSIAQDDAIQVIPQPNKIIKTEGNFSHQNK